PERMWRSDLPPSEASVPADSAAAGGGAGRRVIGQSRTKPSPTKPSETKPSETKQAKPRAKATRQLDNSKRKGGGGRASDDDDSGGAGPDELAALDDLGGAGTWEVFGRRLRLTNLDKELFPARRA